MSSIFDSQNLKKKISLLKKDDDEMTLIFQFNIQSNHHVDTSILSKIETYINELLSKDYDDLDDVLKAKKQQADHEKQEKLFEKNMEQKEKEYQKLLSKQKLEKERRVAKIEKQKVTKPTGKKFINYVNE